MLSLVVFQQGDLSLSLCRNDCAVSSRVNQQLIVNLPICGIRPRCHLCQLTCASTALSAPRITVANAFPTCKVTQAQAWGRHSLFAWGSCFLNCWRIVKTYNWRLPTGILVLLVTHDANLLQFTDIQASLEGANHSGPSTGTHEGQKPSGSPSEPKGSGPLSPVLSPETSAGQLQGECSQGSLGTVSGDEQKKKAKREWQQSLRSSGKFKNSDAQKSPWGLSAHGPKLERR